MHTRTFAALALLASTPLAGCDGRLDVLEPERDAMTSGGTSAGGSAGSSAGGGAGSGSGPGGSGAGGSLPVSPALLDDFEDGDTKSLGIDEGYWYFRPDGTCTGVFASELTADRAGSTHSMRTRGGGCTEWGSLLGLDLGGSGDVYDASSFDALRFWARAEPGFATTINVSLLNPQHFDTVIGLGAEWQEYVLPLDGFTFNDRPPAQPYDPSKFTHLQFFVFSEEPFDYWIDDVAFVRAE